MGKRFTASDGTMMIILEEAEEGGFCVTSPLDPGLHTQAETIQEAFEMAYDAAECLAQGRKILAERLDSTAPAPAPMKSGRKSRGRKADVS